MLMASTTKPSWTYEPWASFVLYCERSRLLLTGIRHILSITWTQGCLSTSAYYKAWQTVLKVQVVALTEIQWACREQAASLWGAEVFHDSR